MIAFADPFTWIAAASMLAGLVFALTQKAPKVAPKDDGLQSNATRGSYVPLAIGRVRAGPLFAWVKDMTTFDFGGGGESLYGKGGPQTPQSTVFAEESMHILAVGPGTRLFAIYENGEKIWPAAGDGISVQDTASGSSINVSHTSGGTSLTSTFKIYWGLPDDPTVDSPDGTPTRWPHALKVLWQPKRLGGTRNWGRLEYEFECPCYSQIATTPSEVPLKVDWTLDGAELATWSPTVPVGPFGSSPISSRTAQQVFDVVGYDGDRTVLIAWSEQAVRVTDNHPLAPFVSDRTYKIPLSEVAPGTVLALFSNTPSTASTESPTGYTAALSTLTPQSNTPYYFRVTAVQEGPTISKAVSIALTSTTYTGTLTHRTTRLTLEPVLDVEASMVNELDSVPSVSSSSLGLQYHSPGGSIHWAYEMARIGGCYLAREDINTIGYNPIHIIDQLLFARFPYGAGKARSEWDEQSIENAATVLHREKIRGRFLAADGEGLESALAPIMQDIGLMTPFDPVTGRWVMRLVRDELDVPELPEEIVLKTPEMRSIAGERRVDTIVFSFKDRARNYRQETIAEMDTGEFARFETSKATTVPIEITDDFASAQTIAKRRAQEAAGDQIAHDWAMNHGSALAMPGDVFRAPTIEDEATVFRVSSVKPSLNSSKVEVKTIVDSYSDVPESIFSFLDGPGATSPGTFRLGGSAPQESAPLVSLEDFFAIELPRPLAKGTPALMFGAVRGSGKTASAPVWISRDGSSFEFAGTAVIVARALLGDALAADGPVADEVSVALDSLSFAFDSMVQDLALDETAWRQGKQIALIGDEVIYVRNPEDLGSGLGQMTGLIRGRIGTRLQDHAEGTPVYFFLAVDVERFESAAFVPGDSIEYKVIAAGLSTTDDVSDVVAKSIAVTGKAYTPETPTALRLFGWATDYDVAEPVTFQWSWHSDEFPRTGLGQQTFGQVSGTSAPKGYFLVEVLSAADAVLATVQSEFPFLTLEVDERAAIGGGLDGLSSWKLRVQQVEGSFVSDSVSLEVFPA